MKPSTINMVIGLGWVVVGVWRFLSSAPIEALLCLILGHLVWIGTTLEAGR